MAAKTAFVTGANGFLGLNLVEQLTAAGWSVTALHRPTSDLRQLRAFEAEPVEGDLLDPASLKRALPQGVDAVFHVAADTSAWSRNDRRQTRINVEGTQNVIEAALGSGVERIVYTSSVAALGASADDSATDEDAPTDERDMIGHYKRSKFLAEQAAIDLVKRRDAPVVIVIRRRRSDRAT